MKNWKEKLQDLKCVNGAVYFGSYKNPCDCGDEGCVNQATFEDNVQELEDFIEQIISERDKEIIEIITQHYIPGHMVVNPTLEAIITKITNTK